MKKMRAFSTRIEEKIKIYLSHRPKLYALIVGIGIVIFWRGVWHTADFLHTHFGVFQGNMTTDSLSGTWWDGPLSFAVGVIILFATGAFTSSFIGNELILSGLRGEKRLTQKTESEVKTEEQFVVDIKEELEKMTEKVEQLEREVHKKI
jgi:hypothetical protein